MAAEKHIKYLGIRRAHRAQADALEIEAMAKRRLADEYDAAQERGEVETAGGNRMSIIPAGNNGLLQKAKVEEIGLTAKQVHKARQIRDAEAADPGIIRRTLDEKLECGEEPTKAAVKQAVLWPHTGSQATAIFELRACMGPKCTAQFDRL